METCMIYFTRFLGLVVAQSLRNEMPDLLLEETRVLYRMLHERCMDYYQGIPRRQGTN